MKIRNEKLLPRALALAALRASLATWAGQATTLTVTTTADSGPGSLRQAILDASPGAVMIGFNIPGAGVQTIEPQSLLPFITRSVTIDGYTQPGASPNTLANADNAVLLIELSGGSPNAPPYGLLFAANACTVRGLVVNRVVGAGLWTQISDNNVIEEGVTKGKWCDLGFTESEWGLDDKSLRSAGTNFQGRSMIIWRGANSAKGAWQEAGCWRRA